jgi:serine/threonine protein kinase
MTEVEALTHLHHPNIVNMIEFSNDGVVTKSSGRTYPVIFIVLELATGGEFFDYIATGGQFPERIARFYFRQLIDALDYIHTKGAVHRDLKPENLLFDANYNLKVADFGFAAPVDGRDGSGTLKTKLGTESYMAPEINLKRAYQGASVDLFASGIILFIMITQHPPFTKAIPDDPYYKLICINKLDIFWKAHSRNKPGGEGFFSAEFIDMISSML